MSVNHQTKRFSPNTLTEKIVPIFLIVLALVLLSVFVIIGLSLTGIFPSA